MATPTERTRRPFTAVLTRATRKSTLLLSIRTRLHGRSVRLPDLDLAAVDPGAESEVGGDDEEDAGDYASDDGADVGAAVAGAGAALRVPVYDVGDGGAVGAGHGVGLGFAGCERALGGCLDGGRERGASSCFAADNALDGFGDGVAVGAFDTGFNAETALVDLLCKGIAGALFVFGIVALESVLACYGGELVAPA